MKVRGLLPSKYNILKESILHEAPIAFNRLCTASMGMLIFNAERSSRLKISCQIYDMIVLPLTIQIRLLKMELKSRLDKQKTT